MNSVKCPHCGAYTVNEPIEIVARTGGLHFEPTPITRWDMHSQMQSL